MSMERVVDPVIETWVKQLLDLDPLVTEAVAKGQVEIRLRANRGRVRAHPVIVLNGGPSEMTEPE